MVLKNLKAKPLILVFCFIFFQKLMYGGFKEGGSLFILKS